MARKISNLSASYMRLWLVEFYTLFRIQVQDLVSIDIEKKRGSSIDLDIHHSKVFSSGQIVLCDLTWPKGKFMARVCIISAQNVGHKMLTYLPMYWHFRDLDEYNIHCFIILREDDIREWIILRVYFPESPFK